MNFTWQKVKSTRVFQAGVLLALLLLLASCGRDYEIPEATPELQATQCNPTVTGNKTGLNGTTHKLAYDGDLSSFFQSSHNDWQFVQIDLGCEVELKAIRRYMTHEGDTTTGNRGYRTRWQGEGASYSLDGVTWTKLTSTTTTGWQGYVNYKPHAWHTLPYGWSKWLELNTATRARYVRFEWDGDYDALNEVELDYQELRCDPVVTSSHLGLYGTTPSMAFDGQHTTSFKSSYENWQYIQVDFGCTGTLSSIRRDMTRNGWSEVGTRGQYTPKQGEGASYSLDGVTWIRFTRYNATGWEAYVNYAAHAWHTLPYGFSHTLRLHRPAQARYVRFNWDGDGDAVNELMIDFR